MQLWIPDGADIEERAQVEELPTGRGSVVNDTDLPDEVVLEAVETYFEEHSSILGTGGGASLSAYGGRGGSMAGASNLTRPRWHAPNSILEEILQARDLAERDDDVASTLGAMSALAFGEGMQNTHQDEVTVAIYDEIAKDAKLETRVFPEMYRELLIAGQVTTATIFIRKTHQFTPMGADRQRSRDIATPLVGVLPAEQIRVLGNDLFGTAALAYRPVLGSQESWLGEFFAAQTTPGRKAEMRAQDPLLTTLLIEQIRWERYDEIGAMGAYGDPSDPAQGTFVYRLNPSLVARSTFPKGQWANPRPPLTRNLPLLEAKRLLNIMDYALLQGGANFLVVAKKGTDAKPALPQEIAGLRDTIRRASRSGVVIGDHRLSIEVITPNLDELLNTGKRKLLGHKLTTAMLRIPDFQSADQGSSQSVLTDTEIISRVVASDRRMLKRHVEDSIYEPTSQRNGDSLNGAAKIWFPRIILQGAQYFTDLVLKLRDRGDIPRKYAIEAGGFDYTAAVQQRRLEKSSGDDRVLTPAAVPFSQGNSGPQDNGGGRPPGGSSANGAPGSAPPRSTTDPGGKPMMTIARNAGETVKAMYDEDSETTFRAGTTTFSILEEYSDTKEIGRLTAFEKNALAVIDGGDFDVLTEGPLTVVPVNHDEQISYVKAVRLGPGLSILVGQRDDDGAVMARAICFREPEFRGLDAEERAISWGFMRPQLESGDE